MDSKFKDLKILIANRGEIAIRIAKTCKRLGFAVIGIFEFKDSTSEHLKYCDEVFEVASYIDINSVITAINNSKADFVHPGYGFLSENADFVSVIERTSAKFIGSTSEVIRQLGNKINARSIANSVKVPLSKSIHIDSNSEFDFDSVKKNLSFPLVVKSSSGGGGRGIRFVHSFDHLEDSISSVIRESKSLFNTSEIYIEEYIQNARHIEVQIIGDIDGSAIVLGTRDCSWQRNNQKVVEEAPAPSLSAELLRSISNAAKKLAEKVKLKNAATVEFLVNESGDFFFLEVNTRIQVEHTITEEVFSTDIVELQILVANGISIKGSFSEDKLFPNTVSIQARLCSEIPEDNYSSSTGCLEQIKIFDKDSGSLKDFIPKNFPNKIRCDFGYIEGSVVSGNYDSLLGKIISIGNDRNEAINNLLSFIRTIRISGLRTNQSLLVAILKSNLFSDIKYHIKTLSNFRDYSNVVLSYSKLAVNLVVSHISNDLNQYNYYGKYFVDNNSIYDKYFKFVVNDKNITIKATINHLENQVLFSSFFEVEEVLTFEEPIFQSSKSFGDIYNFSNPDVIFESKNETWCYLEELGSAQLCKVQGTIIDSVSISENQVLSPLPGMIVKTFFQIGDEIKVGDTVAIIESMKMEHPVVTNVSGKVVNIVVAEGDFVNKNSRIIALE